MIEMKGKAKGKDSHPSGESFQYESEGRRKPRYARSRCHEIPEPSSEDILEKTRTEKGRVITSRTAKQA
jgi:hypothetical protein